MTTDGATTLFEPEPACASEARRFVVASLRRWQIDHIEDEAALCAAELATNAILHCRTPFAVSVRTTRTGIRIDVQDDRPERLPVYLPPDLDPLASGTTGRGLRMVSALSSRWGYFTTEVAKTVWVELGDRRSDAPSEPVVELTDRPARKGRYALRLVGLPVRAAVASGVQIDDLVREFQLDPDRIGPEDRATFYDLLERSAAPRLIGRQEAFRAAGQGIERYTLELAVSADEMVAIGELTPFLQGLARRSDDEAWQVPPEVESMRAWLNREVTAQLEGRAPSPFPGAALL